MKMEMERNNASVLVYYGVEDRSADCQTFLEKSLTIGRSIFDPIVHEDGGVIAFHFHFHD